MERIFFFVLLSLFSLVPSILLASEPVSKNFDDDNVKVITRYLISIPDKISRNLQIDEPGIGSSLKLKNKNKDGSLWLYSVTDRGMNLEVPNLTTGESVKVFPQPEFSPFICLIKVVPSKAATLEKIVTLEASGIPIPQSMSSAKVEVPLTFNLERIKNDTKGIDPEGLDMDSEGNFWLVEEYGPSLLKVSPDGKILERTDLSNGLPEIIKHRFNNRGMESLAITPNGKIIFALESILNINNETKDTALFIRFIEFDPASRKIRMFAYEYDKDVYASPASVKIGDMVAIDKDNLLVIEQGKDKNGEMRNTIQIANLSRAADISSIRLPNGKELEYASQEELNKIQTITKKFLIDARNYGWPFEKAEGVAYIDPTHIALINDNDFGYHHKLLNTQDQNNENYKIDLKDKTILSNGKPSNIKIGYKKTGIKTELWIIELQKPLTAIAKN